MTFQQVKQELRDVESMTIRRAVYIDANGIEYPIKVDGQDFSSIKEMELKLVALQSMKPEDTIGIRILNNCAGIEKGNPVEDENDVTYVHSDVDGIVTLSGWGG